MVEKLKGMIGEFFVGKEDAVINLLTCLAAGGHVLIEDAPGMGKTTLARTLAGACGCSFSRIQFTPDTMPGDVTGTSVFNPENRTFEYSEGAVMREIILADEINRTSPKTQAALLEAMAEGQVTVDGKTHVLPDPFMVIATQNPIEYLGTYPLPEAELDRFMMKISLGFPTEEEELLMARNMLEGKEPAKVKAVCSKEDIKKIREEASKVKVSDNVLKYIRNIIEGLRNEKKFTSGASPRAFLMLIKASQGRAYISGRDYVIPDDVKAVAVNTIHHRMILSAEAKVAGEDADTIIRGIVSSSPVPLE